MAVVGLRSPVAAQHPATGQFITLARGMEFDDDDPIVAAHPWAFRDEPKAGPVTEVPIEQATAAPGEKRGTRRR
jgi:hypothetical protein